MTGRKESFLFAYFQSSITTSGGLWRAYGFDRINWQRNAPVTDGDGEDVGEGVQIPSESGTSNAVRQPFVAIGSDIS